jgi:hypothetical protein
LCLGREEHLGFLDVVVEPNGHVDVEGERRLRIGVDLEGGADGEDTWWDWIRKSTHESQDRNYRGSLIQGCRPRRV